MCKTLRLSALLILLGLSGFGCSMQPSQPVTLQSSPPAVCLLDCQDIPAFTGTEHEYILNVLGRYSACAVQQAACKASLLERNK